MLFYFAQTQVVLGCAGVNLCNRSSEACVFEFVFFQPLRRAGCTWKTEEFVVVDQVLGMVYIAQ